MLVYALVLAATVAAHDTVAGRGGGSRLGGGLGAAAGQVRASACLSQWKMGLFSVTNTYIRQTKTSIRTKQPVDEAAAVVAGPLAPAAAREDRLGQSALM